MKYTMRQLMEILIFERDYTPDQKATILIRYYGLDWYMAYKEIVRYTRMLK